MEKNELTKNEKLMLFGIIKYPKLTDKKLSEKLKLKPSTVTAIRNRLRENEYFRTLTIPRLQNMGCKMLVAIYTNFSPLIPLEERVEITGETIEVFDEIFFSVGEQDKGFSLSLAQDYASIGRINDIRTQTFGGRGLLEDEYPNMVVFPFEISKVYRFFNFAPLLKSSFELDLELNDELEQFGSIYEEIMTFSENEKNAYCMLIKYPELSDGDIGAEMGVSRHTVSRLRRKFESNNLIRWINLPNLKNLGFEILSFLHIQFNPRNSPDMNKDEGSLLMSDSTVFMASRIFEAVMISIYSSYDDYNKDTTRIIQTLKENKWIAKNPMIRTYSLNEMIFIKDFKFAPITRKVLGCDFLI